MEKTIHLKVESAGKTAGNFVCISLNDEPLDYVTYGRGLNVAVFDQSTGEMVIFSCFDTFAPGNSEPFVQLLESLPLGRVVVIAVKDEAKQNLSDAAITTCKSLGSQLIDKLGVCHSWALISQLGFTPGMIQENWSESVPVSVSYNLKVTATSTSKPIISATSGGQHHGNKVRIASNGAIVPIEGGYGSGLNVAIFDAFDGHLLSTHIFSVFTDIAQLDAFAKLIEDISYDRVITIAVQNDGQLSLNERVIKACASVGSRLVNKLEFQSLWVLIGQKNAFSGCAIENVKNLLPPDYLSYGSDPVEVSIRLPLAQQISLSPPSLVAQQLNVPSLPPSLLVQQLNVPSSPPQVPVAQQASAPSSPSARIVSELSGWELKQKPQNKMFRDLSTQNMINFVSSFQKSPTLADSVIIININALTNTKENPVVQFFQAGTYEVRVIGKSEGGLYDAWSLWSFTKGCDENGENCTNGWVNQYNITSSEFTLNIHTSGIFATPEQALAKARNTSFKLILDSPVNFFICDDILSDNQGGISLAVKKIPEVKTESKWLIRGIITVLSLISALETIWILSNYLISHTKSCELIII